MIVVLDASVILKWLFQDPSREPDTAKALVIIESVVSGRLEIIQPVHWLVEVAAVAARLTPHTAVSDVERLAALEFPTNGGPDIMRRATDLAIATDHHLFDTLYHAVAIETEDALLVTADERYLQKAERYGMITALRYWESPRD